jgi:hypothetical protein
MSALHLAFIWFWLYTWTPAQGSLRWLFWRTAVVLGYGWLSAVHPDEGLLPLVCSLLVFAHIGGLCMAVWNRDSRFFKHRYGGCQEV